MIPKEESRLGNKHMKTAIPEVKPLLGRPFAPSVFTLFVLAHLCCALAQAVNPPPDGGYPGGNTAEGASALLSLTTGGFNTAAGFLSLRSDATGSFNTAIGAGTLLANTADQNTATGAGALLSNTTASGNTANGAFALFSNTTGGTLGTTLGVDVGPNTAVGSQALQSNTITSANTAVGYQALGNFTIGFMGTDLGVNTAVGFQALGNATGGFGNCGLGWRTLYSNTDGGDNTAIGFNALSSNATGNSNTAVGAGALASNTTGSNNIVIGVGAGSNITSADRVICIGAALPGDNVSNSCFIAGIIDQTSVDGIAVLIGLDHKLGTTTSSKRFKEEIKPMDRVSEALFSLKPVTFRYKQEIDPAGTSQFGLVAEDVEKVNSDLVVRDKEGKPYSVRYDEVNAMLLNEFLKEHKKIEEQQSKIKRQDATIANLKSTIAQQEKDFRSAIAQQQKKMEVLTTQLKEQGAQIRKVRAQVEIDRSPPKVVASNP
jgi:trimeric autotransporter adhesin